MRRIRKKKCIGISVICAGNVFVLLLELTVCVHNPCYNGGTCVPRSNNYDFGCKCPESAVGSLCENGKYEDMHLT